MRSSRLAFATLAVTLLMPLAASAQEVTEPTLKAAFIYTFMKFTEWPEPFPASDPFLICVLGDSAVGNALEGQYSDPVSSQHKQDAIEQNGRTARIGLRWNLSRP